MKEPENAGEVVKRLLGSTERSSPILPTSGASKPPEPEAPHPEGWEYQTLTPEQLAAAHKFGEEQVRRQLWQVLKSRHYAWQITHGGPPPPPILTAEELYSDAYNRLRGKVEAKGEKFHECEGQRRILMLLAQYFAGDAKFEKQYTIRRDESKAYYSLRKGLLILGRTGRNKTGLFELFRATARGTVVTVPCEEAVAVYEHRERGGQGALIKAYGRSGVYCFDDLGYEEEGNHFGVPLEVMEYIINFRYRQFDSGQLPGFATHITTNLALNTDGKEDAAPGLLERYGQRWYSRIQAMFNIITIPADVPDYRTL